MADFLRCPASGYNPIEATAPSGGYTAGVLYKVGDCWTQAFSDVAAAAVGVMIVEANRTMVAKATGSGESITAGDRVYVNTTTKNVSKTKSSGDECVGYCTKDAGANDAKVEIALRGHESPDLT